MGKFLYSLIGIVLKKQKNNNSRIVKEKREEIMNFLDKLERKMLDKISVIESKAGQQIEKLIEELSVKQQEAKKLKKDIELTRFLGWILHLVEFVQDYLMPLTIRRFQVNPQ
jgi:histidyl-tRNA synthetase